MTHEHGGNPALAALSLAAAAAGAAAAWAEGTSSSLYAAMPAPDEIVAYTKAICNSIGIAVNTLVGLYHAIRFGRGCWSRWRSRRGPPRRRRDARTAVGPAGD